MKSGISVRVYTNREGANYVMAQADAGIQRIRSIHGGTIFEIDIVGPSAPDVAQALIDQGLIVPNPDKRGEASPEEAG